MKFSCLSLSIVTCLSATGASAGPNAGGALILHYNASVNPTCDSAGYFCGQHDVDQCEEAITRHDQSGAAPDCATCFVLAAFPAHSRPRLVGVSFGLDYDAGAIGIVQLASCASTDSRMEDWPAPGTGTTTTFENARRTRVVALYELVAVHYESEPATLRLTPHPTEGGWFTDDATPAERDSIVGFGSMGFDTPGELPCPPPRAAEGACCLFSGACEVRRPAECTGANDVYRGDDTYCDPNPCRPVGGACCALDGSCRQVAAWKCAASTGATWHHEVACEPNPCPLVLPPIGGCCFLSGICVLAPPDECARRAGAYLGDDVPCDAQPCLPRGGCCVAGGCTIATHDQCTATGGTFFGVGMECVPNRCTDEAGCGSPEVSGVPHGEATHLGVADQANAFDPEPGCGTFLVNSDESYEDAHAWQFGGVSLPAYGAFAERFTAAQSEVCAVRLDLTQTGLQNQDHRIDVYVWADDGGCPGRALCVLPNVSPGPVAYWPAVARHPIDVFPCCVDGDFWVGYAGLWSNQQAPFYIAADLDGPGGHPYTNVPPGIGYPSGWHDVSTVWPGTMALGIGCEIKACPSVAVEKLSWGRVKALYKR